jgi:hypothetical protein
MDLGRLCEFRNAVADSPQPFDGSARAFVQRSVDELPMFMEAALRGILVCGLPEWFNRAHDLAMRPGSKHFSGPPRPASITELLPSSRSDA